MTIFNVMNDRREWARVKAGLMTPEDRRFLMEQLIRMDEQGAARYIGELAAEQHGVRRKARSRVTYPAAA